MGSAQYGAKQHNPCKDAEVSEFLFGFCPQSLNQDFPEDKGDED
jgi:hypothetical protein